MYNDLVQFCYKRCHCIARLNYSQKIYIPYIPLRMCTPPVAMTMNIKAMNT